MNMWTPMWIGFSSVSLLFLVAWLRSVKIDNYSLVDAVWAFGIGATAVLWLSIGDGDFPKRIVAGSLVAIWSLRLGGHLSRRIHRMHPEEDARYAKLREHWKGRERSAFFWFFQAQGLSVLLLALPFLFIGRDGSPWGFWESLGLIVTMGGIGGEALADHQMTRFKRANHDPKSVCREGLWRYSRHPNYFFEAVIWIGFYGFACGSQWGWATVHAPAIILFLLLRVTGVPPTEASAIARKGDAYREYQRTTSVFIPLPPKTSKIS